MHAVRAIFLFSGGLIGLLCIGALDVYATEEGTSGHGHASQKRLQKAAQKQKRILKKRRKGNYQLKRRQARHEEWMDESGIKSGDHSFQYKNGACRIQGLRQSLIAGAKPSAGAGSTTAGAEASASIDKGLRELLFSSTKAEVGGMGFDALVGYMESVFNRALAQKKSLEEILRDPKYYPPATKKKIARSLRRLSNTSLQDPTSPALPPTMLR